MNARQTKKLLKKKIDTLKSDNDLMKRIIADSPTMQELYDLYNKPKFVTHTTMHFQEYRAKRFLSSDRPYNAGFIALFKQELSRELFEVIKENIVYEVDAECMTPTITANIFVGIKS